MNKEEVEDYFNQHFLELAKKISQYYLEAEEKPHTINILALTGYDKRWLTSLPVYEALENKKQK